MQNKNIISILYVLRDLMCTVSFSQYFSIPGLWCVFLNNSTNCSLMTFNLVNYKCFFVLIIFLQNNSLDFVRPLKHVNKTDKTNMDLHVFNFEFVELKCHN